MRQFCALGIAKAAQTLRFNLKKPQGTLRLGASLARQNLSYGEGLAWG